MQEEKLSDGIPRMPRDLTRREQMANSLYLHLQLVSRLLFIFAGLGGYCFFGWPGVFIGIVGGHVFGVWMRRSMGLRGSDSFHGWFQRMHERAQGSRRGVLEWLLEKVRANEFTKAKCQDITREYDLAMARLRCCHPQEAESVLDALDRRIKELSYQ